ncbi:hypothetical protein HZC08_02115 [Candidatus Micrarchaeota archaeon]|nr:hypothetical protein [Candidatus Micrarchaeota archaeon]
MTENVKRRISFPLYIGALIITIIIFAIGFYTGSIFNQQIKEDLSQEVLRAGDRISALQLFFLLEDSEEFCPIYMQELSNLDYEIEKIGHRVAYLEEVKEVYDAKLKKDYFFLETSSYLISTKVKQKCDSNYDILVYFYSNKKCESCKQQGEDILKARDEATGKIIKIYSFDGELGSPVADALKDKFNVTVYPTTIINDKKIDGFISKESIISKVNEND